MQYNKEGLYSTEFKLSDLTQATRVRVELKINREGRFRVIDNPNTLVPNANRLLNTYGVLYESEYSFKNFICNTKPYRFDFALFNNNKDLLGLIEYQGDIHFTYKNIGWNTKDKFEERQQRDKAKFDFCKENNIRLYYITYKDNIEKKLEGILNELYGE